MAETLTPLETFTFFPLLPEELRCQIFEESIPQSPRIIEVCQRQQKTEDDENRHHQESDIDADSQTSEDQTLESLTVQNLSLATSETENDTPKEDEESDSSSSSSSSSSDSDSNSPSRVEEEEEVITPPNPNPFYTSTPIPALLHTSRLAREVALRHYTLSFPNPSFHPAKIYYNPNIDTLYFPTWSFPLRLTSFENALSPAVKDTITRIAIDNLMWFSGWSDGCVNDTLQIDQFRNVQELALVGRRPGNQCGCCMEFDGPEKGLVGFEEVEKGKRYEEKCMNDCRESFRRIRERDQEWNIPGVVRCVRLLRDGVLS